MKLQPTVGVHLSKSYDVVTAVIPKVTVLRM
jgi:hypothetical protein